MEGLPTELHTQILSFLDLSSLLTCFSVSKSWYFVASQNILWKQLYYKYYPSKLVDVQDTTVQRCHQGHEWNRIMKTRFMSLSENSLDFFSNKFIKFSTTSDRLRKAVNLSSPGASTQHQIQASTSVQCLQPLRFIENIYKNRVSYFEASICGGASIGVAIYAPHHTKKNAHIGWRATSCGYHADDGSVHVNFKSNYSHFVFGPPFGFGSRSVHPDVVGCGIDFETDQVFFTINGKFLNTVPIVSGLVDKQKKTSFRAAFALHQGSDFLIFNDGTKPFAFDIENWCVHRESKNENANKFQLPPSKNANVDLPDNINEEMSDGSFSQTSDDSYEEYDFFDIS